MQQVIMKEPFDELLAWLDHDRDRAGEKYESIRRSLIKIFSWAGCSDVEGMTDETIDRVAARVQELRESYEGEPALYFYGVARMLIKESWRSGRMLVPLDEARDFEATPHADEEEDFGREYDCLEHCMERLSPADRELVVAYYMKEKQAKIDHRKELARRRGMLTNALRVKVHRLRDVLERCIERCVERPAPDEMD
jgi:DNA-directed RNA polymerase specialized sigma24 family protein